MDVSEGCVSFHLYVLNASNPFNLYYYRSHKTHDAFSEFTPTMTLMYAIVTYACGADNDCELSLLLVLA